MDRATAISIVKKYAEMVISSYSIDKIVLYGSYAKGNFNENSDIDVAIMVNSFSGDFLNVSKMLGKLTRTIDYRIEPVLIDISKDKSGFALDILQYGIIIYDKNTSHSVRKNA